MLGRVRLPPFWEVLYGRSDLCLACPLGPKPICQYVTKSFILGILGAIAPNTLLPFRHSNYLTTFQ